MPHTLTCTILLQQYHTASHYKSRTPCYRNSRRHHAAGVLTEHMALVIAICVCNRIIGHLDHNTYSPPSSDIMSMFCCRCLGDLLPQIQASIPKSLEQKHIISRATNTMSSPTTAIIMIKCSSRPSVLSGAGVRSPLFPPLFPPFAPGTWEERYIKDTIKQNNEWILHNVTLIKQL